MGAAWSSPVINDVATDTADPPRFTRSSHPDALPPGFAEAIKKGYPDLQPLTVPSAVLADVLAAAKRAAAASLPRASVVCEGEGGLELLDVTALLKFKDDVAVR